MSMTKEELRELISGFETRISKAESGLNNRATELTVAETKLSTAQKDLNDVITKIKAAGFNPDTFDEQIVQLSEDIDADLTDLEARMTNDNTAKFTSAITGSAPTEIAF